RLRWRCSRTATTRASATRTGPVRSRAPTFPRRNEEGPLLQGLSREPVGEGARLLDAGARPEGRAGARGARVGHLLRRRGHPRGGAGLLPPPERADPELRV